MPETACLHIQARDSDPIRVVELPGTSVRIGRASYCEVRLSEPDLADEVCRLKRRGGTWQLVPSRAAGFIWLEGRTVEATCSLPFDVPFRVGEHWLTLRPSGSAIPDWVAYKTPEPSASTMSRGDVRPPITVPRDRDDASDLFDFAPPTAHPLPAPDYDHVSRWKVQQAKRANRTNLTPEERRWEERWRAAGERVRARPTIKPTPVAAPPLTTPPTVTHPVASSPVANAPLSAAAPTLTGRAEASALRHARFGASDLRERVRRTTTPIDRRPTLGEVSPAVPPIPSPALPRVENVPHVATTPYVAPEIAHTQLPTIENRVRVSPQFDWPPASGSSTPDAPVTTSTPFSAPASSPAEPSTETFGRAMFPVESFAPAEGTVAVVEPEDDTKAECLTAEDQLTAKSTAEDLEAPAVPAESDSSQAADVPNNTDQVEAPAAAIVAQDVAETEVESLPCSVEEAAEAVLADEYEPITEEIESVTTIEHAIVAQEPLEAAEVVAHLAPPSKQEEASEHEISAAEVEVSESIVAHESTAAAAEWNEVDSIGSPEAAIVAHEPTTVAAEALELAPPEPLEEVVAEADEASRTEESELAALEPLQPVATEVGEIAETPTLKVDLPDQVEAHSPVLEKEQITEVAANVDDPVAVEAPQPVEALTVESPAIAVPSATESPVSGEERQAPPDLQRSTETDLPLAAKPAPTSRGFVADTCPISADEVLFTASQVDLTTSVHDACGLPKSSPTEEHQSPAEPTKPDVQPAGSQTSVPLPSPATEWEAPRDGSSRRESGSKAGETVPPSSGRDGRDWPTVSEILASHHASVRRAAAPRPKSRATASQPMLTEYREPGQWSFPIWLGWPPALLAVLAVGLTGCALSWFWSVDARWAGSVARTLASGGANVKALPPTVPTPDGSWWKSTPANLMLWSIYYDRRSSVEPLHAETAKELLTTAAQASPVQSQVRFALARSGSNEGQDPSVAVTTSLGLSRDIEAQAWLGRQLLQAGKKEAALKVYRSALEMAARADVSRFAPPAFDDDNQVLRYYLPGEDVSGRVIRDMADQTNWTFAEWKDALPDFALIPLCAARLLREQGSADADLALDMILNRLDAPPPNGVSAPLHLAAQAEALAWKSRWKEAEAHYREAIEQMPVETIKRSWWMNLAEIDRRLNDDAGRLVALGFAKGNDINDEISQRAVDLLRFGGPRADKGRNRE